MDLGENTLPENYVMALKLRDDGVDEAGIAVGLGIEPRSVPSLLRLADAKLEGIKRQARSSFGNRAEDPDSSHEPC
jgi:hypothetical protein